MRRRKTRKSELTQDMERLYMQSGQSVHGQSERDWMDFEGEHLKGENEYFLKRDKESEEEQFGDIYESTGRGIGEFDGSIGNVKHGAPDDFSERGLYADENYSRDSYGFGDGAVASTTYDSARADRLFDIYYDAGESEFSIRSAVGDIYLTENQGSSGVASSRGRSPRALSGSDEELLERVSDAITSHPEIDASGLSVGVFRSVVKLEGDIRSLEDKWHAEEFVSKIHGVENVENKLRVKKQKS
jgi:hypothetical protein